MLPFSELVVELFSELVVELLVVSELGLPMSSFPGRPRRLGVEELTKGIVEKIAWAVAALRNVGF